MSLLNRELNQQGIVWNNLSEEEQDYLLAEWLIEGYEQGYGRIEYGFLLSALGRVHPKARFKTAWKIFDIWGSLQPPQQAPAAPPELLTAMSVAAFALGRVEVALLISVCYAGLLRVGEALQLKWKDVFFSSGVLTLCLGQTKRGTEQKVVIANGLLYQWLATYLARQMVTDFDLRVFPMSYSSVLRWMKRLGLLLGAQSIQLTTHSFRRSGASELSRRGVPIADICLFGRWLSERSARECIRKGEVAVLRSTALISQDVRNDWSKWCRLVPFVWLLTDTNRSSGGTSISQHRVTQAAFVRLQSAIFSIYNL